MHGLKKFCGLMLAITTLWGGSVMSVNAVEKEENKSDVTYAHELDKQAYDGDDLGAVYKKSQTTFKVWAPTAQRVAVKLYATGSSEEEGAQDISTTAMKKGKNGVWSLTIKGDKKNLYYTYLITNDGVTTETADVYSKAVGVNGNRSMIVDLDSTDPKGWDKDNHVFCEDPTDAIVREVHVRDFSKSEISGVSLKYRGKYLAFTEKGTTVGDKGDVSTCVDYLKKLGVTHVQLMPVYDYATVDETKDDPNEYNWGYDPKNYNVPEGSYSTNPYDGNVRITEFKQMIKALHDAGIGVIMDVVYNHTFTAKGSCFENTVPGYYYRLNDDGSFSDGSGCGNETASEHLMYRKYMTDSILYWINEYHIDGFRFDLMGVHDVQTMNLIRKTVDENVKDGKKIIMYGEPWTASTLATKEKTAVKDNAKLLSDRIGIFNDTFRDAVKGHVFNAQESGFVQDGSNTETLKNSIAANSLGASAFLKQPSQSVTYTSAHDNYTLYDKLVLSVKNDESFDERDEKIVGMNKLSAAIMFTSQGTVFMQAGEEFARTKLGDENSYISSDKINQLDWNNLIKYADLDSYYQGLIEIRKHFKPFRDATTESAKKIAFSDTENGVIAYTLENSITNDSEWKYVAVLFNASDEKAEVTLKQSGDAALPKKWEIVADGSQAGVEGIGVAEGNKITVEPRSALILADKESFDKLGLRSDKCMVTVEYKDSESGDIIERQVLKGADGDGYTVNRSNSYDVEYDYVGVDGEEMGYFTKSPKTVTYNYKKFEGKIVRLTVNYMQEGNQLLQTGDTEVALSHIQNIRQGSKYNAPIKVIDGMRLDIDKFPKNSFGTAYENDITVNYYYKKSGSEDLVLHYFDNSDRDGLCAYVYAETDDGEEVYTEKAPGSKMTPDSKLGKGWYSITLKDKGNISGLKAKFSDPNGKNPDTAEYSVKNESWIENGNVLLKGEVNVICLDGEGNVLKSDVFSGKEGDDYKTKSESFENMKLVGSTENTSGTYTEVPIYVIYSYDKLSITEKPDIMRVAIVLCCSCALTLAAAGILTAIYFNKKKKLKIR